MLLVMPDKQATLLMAALVLKLGSVAARGHDSIDAGVCYMLICMLVTLMYNIAYQSFKLMLAN
jgi:hypothetical protein